LSNDRRQADLQALFFNEPWFLIEGLLWGRHGVGRSASWFTAATVVARQCARRDSGVNCVPVS
jgi:hypothetical protein